MGDWKALVSVSKSKRARSAKSQNFRSRSRPRYESYITDLIVGGLRYGLRGETLDRRLGELARRSRVNNCSFVR